MLYGLEVLHLTKTQLNQLERYHLRTLRQIQSLPQRTAGSAVYMLLGALPIEAEIHETIKFVTRGISSDNKCLQYVVKHQLACSFNEFSFFYMVAQVLEKYSLPTLSQHIASVIGKLQWKNICKQAIESYRIKLYVDDIKTKKTSRYLSVCGLCVSRTPLVWQNLESVSAVRKGIVKARFLTGVYILQSSRCVFSNRTVDLNC